MNERVFLMQKRYKDYKHLNVSGVIMVLGIVMFLVIKDFPKNLLLFLALSGLAVFSYKKLKTEKPVTFSESSICLGKMVNGFENTYIELKDILRIELVSETKTETHSKAIYTNGEINVFSNYYCIYLKNNQEIKFDNLYDDQMKTYVGEWCDKNKIDANLDVKKVIKSGT